MPSAEDRRGGSETGRHEVKLAATSTRCKTVLSIESKGLADANETDEFRTDHPSNQELADGEVGRHIACRHGHVRSLAHGHSGPARLTGRDAYGQGKFRGPGKRSIRGTVSRGTRLPLTVARLGSSSPSRPCRASHGRGAWNSPSLYPAIARCRPC